MADTIEQMQAKVAQAIAEDAPDDAPKAPKEPARKAEPAQEAQDADEVAPEPTPAQKARAEAEGEARKRGWMPKDEWIESGKDEDDWSSAKQFLRRGEEIEERKSVRKTVDSLKKQNEELANLLKKRMANEDREKLLQKSAERDAAIEAGDKAKVHAIDREIAQVSQPVEVTPAELVEFVRENKEWWDVDPMATQAAVLYYGKLERENRDAVSENLGKTKKYLALRFPDLFKEDRASAAEAAQAIVEQQTTRKFSSVSLPNTGNTGHKRGKQWSDLPAESRKVAEQLVRNNVLTREQYLEEFFGKS